MKHFASFSEAIREGAKLRPQGFDRLLNDKGQSCAIGAGLDAMGLLDATAEERMFDNGELDVYSYMTETHLPSFSCPHPNCDKSYYSLRDCVLDLNDVHKLTREAIADWLESEEEKLGYVTVVENLNNEIKLNSERVELSRVSG